MSTIYVIKERTFGCDGKVIGAVTDEKTARKYCRDRRTDKELCYLPVELDSPELTDVSTERVYRVVRSIGWSLDKETPVVEVYNDMMDEEPVALVDEGDWLNVSYASLRTVRLSSNHNGTLLEFWCFAKNAPAALGVAKRTLEGFDPSVLEWGVYHPMRKDSRELKRRLKQFNK